MCVGGVEMCVPDVTVSEDTGVGVNLCKQVQHRYNWCTAHVATSLQLIKCKSKATFITVQIRHYREYYWFLR